MHFFKHLNFMHHLISLSFLFLLSCVILFSVYSKHTEEVKEIAIQHEKLQAYSEQLFYVELEVLHARLDNLNLTNYKINRFFKKFDESITLIKNITQKLIKFNLGLDNLKNELILFNKGVDNYYNSVNGILKMQSKMGFHADKGILVDLEKDRAKIEAIFSQNNQLLGNVILRDKFYKILLLEKDFSRSLNMKRSRLILTSLQHMLDSVEDINLNDEMKVLLKNNLVTYHAHFRVFMRMVIPLELSVAEGRLNFERLLPRLQSIRQDLEQRTQIALNTLKQKEMQGFLQISIALGIALLILTLFSLLQLYRTRSSNYRINQLNKSLNMMSEGNYKISQGSLPQGQDEIGQLSENFYVLSAHLQAKMTAITAEKTKLEVEKSHLQK